MGNIFKIKFLLLILLVLVLLPKPAKAQYIVTQQTPLPTGITIEKFVINPDNKQLTKVLNSNVHVFLPDQEVPFRINVTNTGQSELDNVQVKDQFPDFVDFVPGSGPGTYDASSRLLNITIDRLKPGETRTIDLRVKVKPAKVIPSNMSTCLTNFAEARVNALDSQTTAVFCIQNQIVPATELPKTGPAETTYFLGASFILLLTSIFMFSKAKYVEGR